MIDDQIEEANDAARDLSGTTAAIAMLSHATTPIARRAHYPAGGVRAVIGWVDSTGQRCLVDEPVLWFDFRGEPVTVTFEAAEPIIDSGPGIKYCLYHPDTHRPGDDEFSASAEAVKFVNEALDALAMRTEVVS